MQTNLGLSDESRLSVGLLLNLLVADEYVLYATTRDYHWNVTGPDFDSLHLLFETQFGQISQWLDDIAERARTVGVGAHGNWTDLTKAVRSSAASGIGLPPNRMLSELLALHENLVVHLRADTATSERLGDAGTTDFLTGLLEQHEKAAWLLRSHLETTKEKRPALT